MNLWQQLLQSRSAGMPLGLMDVLAGQSPLPAFTPQSYLQPYTPNLQMPQTAPAPSSPVAGPIGFTGQNGPMMQPGIGMGGASANGWGNLFGQNLGGFF